jgi:hypothetical protein
VTLSKTFSAVLLLAFLVAGCGGWFEMGDISHEDASDRVIEGVNEALDAGLQGKSRPAPTPLSYHICTDDLGLDNRAMPTFSYVFPLTLLGSEGSAFGERATAVWKSHGMKITESDNAGVLNRFAVSDDGFRFSITVNQQANQVYIGGSGPCVDPPEGVL